ncbi:hypothetical protein CHS0354_012693 [Potamilus streckersoni]|uniref:Magnesium transporter NIPA2 n=1 Tax=Potamilus streckersoni TaxID=2493646 RepID=A0AAE0SYM2_9BIVA|nr:hypothetical protein CHS0354_012693 [Potamilus streckersoni]
MNTTVYVNFTMTSPSVDYANTTNDANDTLWNTSTTTVHGTTGGWRETPEQYTQDFYIGLALAIVSSILCGISYIFKKRGLLRSAARHGTRAGEGGLGYLKEWPWWAGMVLMVSGEFSNFAAYAFAPASLVTPLGALSVITCAILASRFLKERLNILGKIGCAQCLFGSTVMVILSPKEPEVHSMEELLDKLKGPVYIVWAILAFGIAISMMIFVAPKYGNKHLLVYLVICSLIGSFTVSGCKGLGVAIKETIGGRNEFTNWLTWVLLVLVIVCILTELNYFNRALDTFNTAVVTPIYYVFFTTTVITASLILFQEWGSMTFEKILGNICGFCTIVLGIFLLNAFKDIKVTLGNISSLVMQTKQQQMNGDIPAVELVEEEDGSGDHEENLEVKLDDEDKVEIHDNNDNISLKANIV